MGRFLILLGLISFYLTSVLFSYLFYFFLFFFYEEIFVDDLRGERYTSYLAGNLVSISCCPKIHRHLLCQYIRGAHGICNS